MFAFGPTSPITDVLYGTSHITQPRVNLSTTLLFLPELPGWVRGERGLDVRVRAAAGARGGGHQELALPPPRRGQPTLTRRHHRRLGHAQGAFKSWPRGSAKLSFPGCVRFDLAVLLLLTTSVWPCLQHPCNLVKAI